jgi:uncharacterized protein
VREASPFSLTHLLYLHGFRSSPRSFKARMLARWMHSHRPDVTWRCPQLPPSPREAIALCEQLTHDWPAATMAVVGSSLGGFYATVMAERRGCRALLLNPAVDPARDLERHIGTQASYHDASVAFEFTREHVDELRRMWPPTIARPEHYAAIIAKGDELLDWREMTTRCHGANVRLLEGGDHALSDFDQHLPFVLEFLACAREIESPSSRATRPAASTAR